MTLADDIRDLEDEAAGWEARADAAENALKAISHIEEEHWTADLTDMERDMLVADARRLGFDPDDPRVTCWCGGEHITGSCLSSGDPS